MQRTGQFLAGRWTAKVELLPGEFEIFSRSCSFGGRPGHLLFTNQRFIWRPSFKPKATETDLLLIAHERVSSIEIIRPWQRLFLNKALRLKVRGGETINFYVNSADTLLPVIREHMSRKRYKVGDLFR